MDRLLGKKLLILNSWVYIFLKYLTFQNHVAVIARKLSKFVDLSFKLFKYLSFAAIKTLYYSLMNPFYYTELKFGTARMLTLLIKYSSWIKAWSAIHTLPFNTHRNEDSKNAKILKLPDLIYESQIWNTCSNV